MYWWVISLSGRFGKWAIDSWMILHWVNLHLAISPIGQFHMLSFFVGENVPNFRK